jgi:hypothetical protein
MLQMIVSLGRELFTENQSGIVIVFLLSSIIRFISLYSATSRG